MNASTIKKLSAPFLAAALAVGAAACGSSDDAGSNDAPDVTITDPWIREPADGQTLAAAYGVITNDGEEPVTLIGADAPIEATIEIHETTMSDEGTMSMSEKDGGFEIAPGESLTLEPGGAHIMMLDIDPAEITGTIELTYEFDGGAVTVPADVRPIGDEMEMDEMHDGEMDDGEG